MLAGLYFALHFFPSLFPHTSLRVTLVINDTFIFNDFITEFKSDYKSFNYF
jgi:hypothetical protein